MDALASGNVENVVIDLDFATNELAFIDLFGYLLGAYLGGAGLPWETLSPPQDGSDATYGTWSSAVAEWRTERRQDMGFPSDAANALANPANPAASAATAYDDPDLAWVRSNFVSPQVMLHDRYLFDRNTGNWPVTKPRLFNLRMCSRMLMGSTVTPFGVTSPRFSVLSRSEQVSPHLYADVPANPNVESLNRRIAESGRWINGCRMSRFGTVASTLFCCGIRTRTSV